MISAHSFSSKSTASGFLGRSSSFCNASSSVLIPLQENTDRASDPIGLNSASVEARSTGFSAFDLAIASLPPVVCTSDGRGGPGPAKAKSRPGRAHPPVSQRSAGPCRGGSRPDRQEGETPTGQGVLRRLHEALGRLDTSLIGDVLGAFALFALLYACLLLGAVLEGL